MNDNLKSKISTLKSALKHATGEFEYEGEADTLAEYVMKLCDLLNEVLETVSTTNANAVESEKLPEEYTGITIKKYISSSGNTTWKLTDDKNKIIYLRQNQRELYEQAGLWDSLNELPFDVEHQCRIVLDVVQDGDFLKPVRVVLHRIAKQFTDEEIEIVADSLLRIVKTEAKRLDVLEASQPKLETPLSALIAMLNSRDDYLVLDTETTDMNGEIVELAIWDNSTKLMHEWLVKPVGTISRGAQQIHGITAEMVADKPRFSEIAPDVIKLIKNRPLVIYNASYDMPRLEYSANKADENWAYGWYEIPSSIHCAMLAYAEHYGDWDSYHGNYSWQKLGMALKQCGLKLAPEYQLHRAAADVMGTLKIIHHMKNSK